MGASSADSTGSTPRRRDITHECVYRVVWSTKYGRPLLDGVEQELRVLLLDAAAEAGAVVEEEVIGPSLVSLRLRVNPVPGLHRTVRGMKARSSSALRARHLSLRTRVPTLWNSRYLVATVGSEPDAGVLGAFARQQVRA